MDPIRKSLGVLSCLLVFGACNTPAPKQADNYDDSPPGGSAGSSARSAAAAPEEAEANPASTAEPASTSTSSAPSESPAETETALPARVGPGWDHDLTAAELARAARSVKANCGSATDTEGNAKGPWGKTQVSVRLHHKGHSKEAKAQGEYAGTPVGHCIERAFTDLQFPPWEGHDVEIQYDIEVVQPK
jgi:hypothetical protein